MKVIQVNGAWKSDGSFAVRNLQNITPVDGGTSAAHQYDDWNTVTNILKLIVQSLLLYQSQDGYIYVSADGYAYVNKV